MDFKERREIIVRTKYENPTWCGSQIAKFLKYPPRTVTGVLKRYNETLTTERKKGSGRKKKFCNPQLVGRIKRSFLQNPGLSTRDRARKFGCSDFFIRKVMKSVNLKSFKAIKFPNRNDKQNLTARRTGRKLYDFILCKSKRCIGMDDETYVKYDFRQLPGNKYYVSHIRGRVNPRYKYILQEKFAKKVMIWQVICSCGRYSKAYVIKKTMKADNYISECLTKAVLPLIRSHTNGELKPIFWPDKAACHYAKKTVAWMNDKNIDFVPKNMNPTNCPELRPIERLWAIVKGKLRRSGRVMNTPDNLKKNWDREVDKLGKPFVRRLMEGVRSKVREFIREGDQA
jgi:hypothetical protein